MREAAGDHTTAQRSELLTPVIDSAIDRISPLTDTASAMLQGGSAFRNENALNDAVMEATKTLGTMEAIRDKLCSGNSSEAAPSEPLSAIGAAISGVRALEPAHELPGHALGVGDQRLVIGQVDSLLLSQVVFAPVTRYRGSSLVRQRSQDGYQDQPDLLQTHQLAEHIRDNLASPLLPVLLNGRHRWQWNPITSDRGDGAIQTFDSAAVVDGRVRVGAYAVAAERFGIRIDVPFILLPPMDIAEEQRLYENTRGPERSHPAEPEVPGGPHQRHPSTASPDRLTIGTEPVPVRILTEPYVVLNHRGYSPLVDVADLSTGRKHGMFIGAKTLAQAIEEHRPDGGSIIGLTLAIRKNGSQRWATYSVDRL
jgi:hypothetical protein